MDAESGLLAFAYTSASSWREISAVILKLGLVPGQFQPQSQSQSRPQSQVQMQQDGVEARMEPHGSQAQFQHAGAESMVQLHQLQTQLQTQPEPEPDQLQHVEAKSMRQLHQLQLHHAAPAESMMQLPHFQPGVQNVLTESKMQLHFQPQPQPQHVAAESMMQPELQHAREESMLQSQLQHVAAVESMIQFHRSQPKLQHAVAESMLQPQYGAAAESMMHLHGYQPEVQHARVKSMLQPQLQHVAAVKSRMHLCGSQPELQYNGMESMLQPELHHNGTESSMLQPQLQVASAESRMHFHGYQPEFQHAVAAAAGSMLQPQLRHAATSEPIMQLHQPQIQQPTASESVNQQFHRSQPQLLLQHDGAESKLHQNIPVNAEGHPQGMVFAGMRQQQQNQMGMGMFAGDCESNACNINNSTSQSSSGSASTHNNGEQSVRAFRRCSSKYRGVSKHRGTGRFEAHLWDNTYVDGNHARKGKQVYLGGYDDEVKAARAYDLAALKYWGPENAHTNFKVEEYEKEVKEMESMPRSEFVAMLRRQSKGFSRGCSHYRGVTRHAFMGKWQARMGRVQGNRDLYLGTFHTQHEAAEAYDIAAIRFRGRRAVTNFPLSHYDLHAILSTPLPLPLRHFSRSACADTHGHLDMNTGQPQPQQQQQQNKYVYSVPLAKLACPPPMNVANAWNELLFNGNGGSGSSSDSSHGSGNVNAFTANNGNGNGNIFTVTGNANDNVLADVGTALSSSFNFPRFMP